MRAKVLALLVVVGLVAAACGGGDDDDTSAEESAPAATEDATSEPTEEPTDEATEEPTEGPTEEPTEDPASGDETFYWDLLEIGTCFDDPPNYDDVIPTIDCAEAHENEVFAHGDYSGDAVEFPGADELWDYADLEICDPAYEVFMGVPIEEATISSFSLVPDEESWNRGDRRLICGVYDETGAFGTAASAGLPAPDLQVLGVSNLDDQADLYVSTQGEIPEAVTNDPEEEMLVPPGIGPDGRVVYARFPLDDSSAADIFALELSGEITTLLATPADEGSPQLSPDGSKIVYWSDEGTDEYDIWVMDADGSNPTRLTTNPDRDGNPSWSPDGTQIVYRARHDGVSNIWIMNADGSDQRELSDDPAGDFDPFFSPDGTKIAFSSERSGNFDVWVMNADGSDPINLTNHPAADEFPSWTSDGAGIAFTSDRVNRLIWIMRADGSDQTLFSIDGPSGYGTATGTLG